METMLREGGDFTLFRGRWGAAKHTRPLLNFYPGWGLELSIEFPSTWHEDGKLAMLRFCLLWGNVTVYFPWYRLYEDHYQCSGPRFGFHLTTLGEPDGPMLFLYYGNDKGTPKGSRTKIIYGPWSWGTCVRHDKFYPIYTAPYRYKLRSGKVQRRTATFRVIEQEWRRWWLPYKMVWRGIDVQFDEEVGERSGSWKGGTVGCGYELLPGETPVQCLRRMERERKF